MVIQHRKAEVLCAWEKNALGDLLSACRQAEPITLSFPDDVEEVFWAWDGEGLPLEAPEPNLLGCLAVCLAEEDEWECYAFTRPKSRRQGIFCRLLEALEDFAGGQEELLGREISLAFLSDGKSPEGLAAAEALGMAYGYSEYRMVLELKGWREKDRSGENGSRKLLEIRGEEKLKREDTGEEGFEDREGEKSQVFCGYSKPDGFYIGTCSLLPYDDSRYYLYHVEIQEKLRGKGWGKSLLSAVLAQLPEKAQVFLQVASWNEPAVNLYEKTGFRITETLSYYFW